MMSRILGTNMTLLFFLRFLINHKKGVKAAGRFYKFFILNRVFFSFLGRIIHILLAIDICGYLYYSCLLRRFPTLSYCKIQMNGLRGRIE